VVKKVAILPGAGKRDPDAILQTALESDLDAVTIIGWKDDDTTFYWTTSYSVVKDVLWDLETMKNVLME
jgi:hypothetical protein